MADNQNKNWWQRSRQTLNRLFQFYCQDYGPEAGEKIIKTIIDVLGGCRITIPLKFPNNPETAEVLLTLYTNLSERFSEASAKEIMRKFIMELKGRRIAFPSWKNLSREERNRKIRNMFTGSNYKELAIMFGLSRAQVWRVINREQPWFIHDVQTSLP
ncbi:MAG: hypothetical protein IBX72_06920 [Nitrospirae bacterium]|nr:hypothetical protein [Nitrospirota bacterium]